MATVRDLLSRGTAVLHEAGVDTPRLDAELIVAHVLGETRARLWTYPERAISPEHERAILVLLQRRRQREPLPYLLGEWEFYGRPFYVTPDVLIPRPETELLVEAVIHWARAHDAHHIADIGVGSGAIAVTLAAELPAVSLYAVDLSPRALAVARRNADRHGVTDRITFLEGDLLEPLRDAGHGPLDAIVANLPYIAEEEMPTLMPEVRDYEPDLALRAGEGGLALILRLIRDGRTLLVPGGLLALEVGAGQAERVADAMGTSSWYNIRVITDYGGIPRHVLGESTV